MGGKKILMVTLFFFTVLVISSFFILITPTKAPLTGYAGGEPPAGIYDTWLAVPSTTPLLYIRPTHPRIFITEENLPTIRCRVGLPELDGDGIPACTRVGNLSNHFAFFKTRVDVKNVTFSQLTGSQLDDSGTNSDYLYNLAFLYQLTKNPGYCISPINYLQHRHDAHNKSVASGAWMQWSRSAYLYDWCYDLLTTQQRKDFAQDMLNLLKDNGHYFPNDSHFYDTETGNPLSIYGEDIDDPLWLDEEIRNHYTYLRNCIVPGSNQFACDGEADGYIGYFTEGTIGAAEVFRTATSYTTMFEESRYLQDTASYYIHRLRGDRRLEKQPGRISYGGMNLPEFFSILASRYNDSYAQWAAKKVLFDWNGVDPGDSGSVGGYWPAFLWYDVDFEVPEDIILSYRKTHYKDDYDTCALGVDYMRSDWDFSDTSKTITSYFVNMPSIYGFSTFTQNHFGIMRGTDSLLIDSGQNSCGNQNSFAYWNYYSRTIAHNSMTIFDQASTNFGGVSNDGGQYYAYMNPERWPIISSCNPTLIKDYGDTIIFEDVPDTYTYILANSSKAYNTSNQADIVLRSFLYIPPDIFVVHDKVRSKNANFPKRYNLHMIEKPTGDGTFTQLEGTAYGGIYESTNTQDLTIKYGESALLSRTLLPAQTKVRIIGGANADDINLRQNWDPHYELTFAPTQSYEYYVNGRLYPLGDFWNSNQTSTCVINRNSNPADSSGDWRVEIEPATPSLFDTFLTVMYVRAGDLIADDHAASSTRTGNFVDCKPWIVSGKYQNDCYLAINPTATAKATWNPVVTTPGQYTVQVWIPYPIVDGHPGATAANYAITHGTTTETVVIDYTGKEGDWVTLGTYEFPAGPAKIELTRGAAGETLFQDDLRLVHLDDTLQMLPTQLITSITGNMQGALINNTTIALFSTDGYPVQQTAFNVTSGTYTFIIADLLPDTDYGSVIDGKTITLAAGGSTYRTTAKGTLTFTATITGTPQICTPQPGQNNYYVDINSLCGPCDDMRTKAQNTVSTPWCTMSTAITNSLPGDTIYVQDGMYNTIGFAFTKSGNATHKITYKALGHGAYLGNFVNITDEDMALVPPYSHVYSPPYPVSGGMGDGEYGGYNRLIVLQTRFPPFVVQDWSSPVRFTMDPLDGPLTLAHGNLSSESNWPFSQLDLWNGTWKNASGHLYLHPYGNLVPSTAGTDFVLVNNTEFIFIPLGTSHLVLDGFQTPYNALDLRGSAIEVYNYQGMVYVYGSNNTLENITSAHAYGRENSCGIPPTGPPCERFPWGEGGTGHAFAISGMNNMLKNVEIKHSRNGIMYAGPGNSYENIFVHGVTNHCGNLGSMVNSTVKNVYSFNCQDGLEYVQCGAQNVLVEHSYFMGGVIFEENVSGRGNNTNITFRNNIFGGCYVVWGGNGIRSCNYEQTMVFENNLFLCDANSHGGQMRVMHCTNPANNSNNTIYEFSDYIARCASGNLTNCSTFRNNVFRISTTNHTDVIVGGTKPYNIDSWDYHLTSASSAAVDIGSSSTTFFDFEGQVRPQGAGFDAGPDEWDEGGQTSPTCTLSSNPSSGTGPFTTQLTATFANIQESTATLYCDITGVGQSVPIIGNTATRSCTYPQVNQNTTVTARATASTATCDASITDLTTLPPGYYPLSACGQVNKNVSITADLTTTATDCLIVTLDGITIDGNGHTVTAASNAVLITHHSNVTVTNIKSEQKIYIDGSYAGAPTDNNSILNSQVRGISVYAADGAMIRNNLLRWLSIAPLERTKPARRSRIINNTIIGDSNEGDPTKLFEIITGIGDGLNSTLYPCLPGNHLVENNTIINTAKQGDEVTALRIRCSTNDTVRGNIILGPEDATALYFRDDVNNSLIENNYIRTKRGGLGMGTVMMGAGWPSYHVPTNNIFRNNTFITESNIWGLRISLEGNTFSHNIFWTNHTYAGTMSGSHGGNTFDHNTFYNAHPGTTLLIDQLQLPGNAYTNNIFSYDGSSGMELFLFDHLVDYHGISGNNNIYHNRNGSVRVYSWTLAYWMQQIGEYASLEADPLLFDPQHLDLSLPTNSPACGSGSDGSDIGAISCNQLSQLDTTPPFSTTPPDQTVTVGEIAIIPWRLFDIRQPGNYTILRNATVQNNNLSWPFGDALNISVNTTLAGVWNYTILFSDAAGNAGIPDTVIVIVLANQVCNQTWTCTPWSLETCGERTCTCACVNGTGCLGDGLTSLDCDSEQPRGGSPTTLKGGGSPTFGKLDILRNITAKKLCEDGLDNEGGRANGCIDERDYRCGGIDTRCTGGVDNDCDGMTDCADPDCLNDSNCQQGEQQTTESPLYTIADALSHIFIETPRNSTNATDSFESVAEVQGFFGFLNWMIIGVLALLFTGLIFIQHIKPAIEQSRTPSSELGELSRYIQRQLAKGTSTETIKNNLRSVGWIDEVIDKVFEQNL